MQEQNRSQQPFGYGDGSLRKIAPKSTRCRSTAHRGKRPITRLSAEKHVSFNKDDKETEYQI